MPDGTSSLPDVVGDASLEGFVPSAGTRLEARRVGQRNGASTFVGFHDRQLDVDCTFVVAADGQYRCLPFGLTLGQSLFADPQCLQPVALAQDDARCQQTAYVVQLDRSFPCQGRTRVRRAGSRVENRQVFTNSGGGCTPGNLAANADAYRIGDELSPASFVGATLADDEQAGALGLITLVADDGAQMNVGWRDQASKSDCTMVPLSDHQSHCIPGAVRVLPGVFSDSGCQTATAAADPACPAPLFAREFTLDSCPSTAEVRRVGAKVEASFQSGPTGCRAAPPATGTVLYALGAVVAPETFASLEHQPEGGPDQLQRLWAHAPGGQRNLEGLYDAARSAPCVPLNLEGTLRCVPDGSGEVGADFADPQCTQPIYTVSSGVCPPAFARLRNLATCPSTNRLFSVGTRYDGPVYRRDPTSSCMRRVVGPSEEFRALGPLPASDFPSLETITGS